MLAPGNRASKQRFYLLDGMRGVAAFSVALFHLTHIANRSAHSPNGVIAVDFFFCLSGFVIAHAHDIQLATGKLSASRFMALRLLRVAPMIWLGTAVGALLLPLNQANWAATGSNAIPAMFFSLFALPWIRAGKDYWINGVYWSLLAELIANLSYSLLARRLTTTILVTVIAISASTFLAAGWGIQPGAGDANGFAKHLKGPAVFPFLFARALTSFFIGVGVLRCWRARVVRVRVGWVLPSFLLLVILAVTDRGAVIGWFNTVAVFSLIPAIVYLGACAELRRPRLADALGAASFPLYALHQPIEQALGWTINRLTGVGQTSIIMAVPIILLGAALLIARHVDEPFREWIRPRLFKAHGPI